MSTRTFKFSVILFSIVFHWTLQAQTHHGEVSAWNVAKLNTAVNESYMTVQEKDMILEINKLRSNPKKYAEGLEHFLDKAKERLKNVGKGARNYSVRTSYSSSNNSRVEAYDTTWNYENEEEVKAIKSLILKLNTLSPLSILLPSNGIYVAAKKHAIDQIPTGEIDHIGTDGSRPWDRIKKTAPSMKESSENIACGEDNARAIVIQLLIDSGIPGYGHRENLLNPHWTHCACYHVGHIAKDLSCCYWIQNFGTVYSH